MKSHEIRLRFLEFFRKRGHAILPSASLVPENDPSVLFNTAGMQPLVPYLMGQRHPLGNRLASCQKCVRTGDIEEVGNHKNFTFFEMLGNWSLGDYFKEDAIKWSYEFLTSAEEGLGLDPSRLYVTVFEGDDNAPRDMEAVEIWKKFIPENRIYFLPAKNNWWSPGDNGPCGPDTEMFYDVTPEGLGDLTHDEYVIADDRGDVVEIWNDVFMQYEKKDGIVVGKLDQKNVDTGSGLERVTMLMQGASNAYDTDIFTEARKALYSEGSLFEGEKTRYERIVLDHLRTALFMAGDGVFPSNKDAGYIMRRLVRRGCVYIKKIAQLDRVSHILDAYVNVYGSVYPELTRVQESGYTVILDEIQKFQKTLDGGLREFDKGTDPFILATTYGFPIELTEDLAIEKGIVIDREKFDREMKEHQNTSRAGAGQKFKGGLANTNDATIKLHTAHHLLLAALQSVLGSEVKQRGSNITEERLRIDFNFDRKMTDEEKERVEVLVNQKIKENLEVVCRQMPKEQAERLGAQMEFGAKYPDTVSVYSIGSTETPFSIEFCGGPHVTHTQELGHFKILKEEAVSQGVRRIKAILE